VVKSTELTTPLQIHRASSDSRIVIYQLISQISLESRAAQILELCLILFEVYYSFDVSVISLQHLIDFQDYVFIKNTIIVNEHI